MLLVFVLLLSAACLRGEFLRIEVAFADIGCTACLGSLRGRLERVRGVERVDIDVDKGSATLHLAAENRARLAPVLSRITQDGTKILHTRVDVRGTIRAEGKELLFQPSGLTETYRFRPPVGTKGVFETDVMYRVAGEVPQAGPADESVLQAESILAESKVEN